MNNLIVSMNVGKKNRSLPVLIRYVDEKVLTIDDFRQVNRAVFRARAKWREIGTELLLEPHILNNISGSNQDCLTEMLQEWLRQRGLKPSWRKLVEALKDITVREEGIAADIEQEYLIGGGMCTWEWTCMHGHLQEQGPWLQHCVHAAAVIHPTQGKDQAVTLP